MKIFEYTAPPGHDADSLYVTESNYDCIMESFEMCLDNLQLGEEMWFSVEMHEMTEQEWEQIQEDFIE